MPLRAQIDGQEVISTFLKEAEWDNLKAHIKTNKIDVIISQTNKPGYLRKSKLGLQHFAHKRGKKPDNFEPETHHHLFAKKHILLGCKDAGWNAKPEYGKNDWIADVMAFKGDIRVAFEVQWSSQNYETTEARQEKYNRDNIRGCWFFRKLPKYKNKNVLANKRLPLFHLFESDNKNMWISFSPHNFKLRDFICALLKGQVKYCDYLTSKIQQKIGVSFMRYQCHKCSYSQHVYYIQNYLLSNCKNQIIFHDEDWSGKPLRFHPKIVNEVQKFINSEQGKKIKLAKIKRRYSNSAKSSYLSFGCLKCGSIYGDFYYQQDILQAMYENNPIISVDMEVPYIKEYNPHWCFSESKNFCE